MKNCKNDYINKEDEYRKNTKKKLDQVNTKEITLEDVHFDKKQYIKSRLWNEELLSENIFNDYYQEIIKDFFYLLFYNKQNNSVINENQKQFLLFLYEEKNKSDNILDSFYYFFLWAGSYQETIFKFLEIIDILDKSININIKSKENNQPIFLEYLKSIYDSVNFPEEKDDEKKNQKEIKKESNQKENRKETVNGIFYRISESICEIITNTNNIDYSKIKNLKRLCINLNKISQIFSQFNITLSLGLKKQYSLNSIVKLIEYYVKKEIKEKKANIDHRNQLNIFIKNIDIEFNALFNNNINEAIKSFREQLKIVIKLSNKLSMKIFVNKLLEYNKNEEYKLQLINILFEHPDLIKYSTLFFNYIFLLQPIKPKKQIREKLTENEKNDCLKKFGEIKNRSKDLILEKINEEAEKTEFLKEILIYIFELRINSYFEDCKKYKFIQKSPIELLLGLNFDYYKNSFVNINNNNYGKLKTIGMIFYFAFIRCYLNYFVKLQLEERELGDLSKFHEDLLNSSNSNLGKLISLYIAKLFFLYDKKDYFLNNYLKDDNNNWKESILEQNDKVQLFTIKNYDNNNHLLFDLWASINSKKDLSKEFIKTIEISDLSYIINFCYNEMSQKKGENSIAISKLIEEINKIKDNFNFKRNIKNKITKLFKKISDLKFFSENEEIKSNLLLFFNMIKLYIMGFLGNENRDNLTSLIYSYDLNELIKIFLFDKDLKLDYFIIESFYRIKEFLEDENKKNAFPVYLCNCGRWSPKFFENCKCGVKNKRILIFNLESHIKTFENENKKNKDKKITISQLKEEIIIPLLKNFPNLEKLLFNDNKISDLNFVDNFIKYIFSCQSFISDLISKDQIKLDIFKKIINLHISLDKYLETKNIKIYYFLNNFSDSYIDFLTKNDFIKNKGLFYNFIKDFYEIGSKDETFKNIETNILTKLVINDENNKLTNSNFIDKNLKYLLTVTKYPNIDELNLAVKSYKKKPLPILATFAKVEKEKKTKNKDNNINKLLYIEKINNFINAFSEENKNLISRQNIEEDPIEKYLKNSRQNEQENSPLDDKFKDFCEAYDEITNVPPYNMSKDQPVKTILNDDKEKSSIYLLYEHLIKIQNDFLKKVIQEFNITKNDNNDIIIKNAIEQIQKEIPIQNASRADIFEFNVKNNIILSFEELFSFYSMKNIFQKSNNKIDYSNYSNIKFKLSNIEKELINIILTGKKIFSDKQITYEFYLDPYKTEEKTKAFESFTDIYDRENLTENEKDLIVGSIENMRKIILPNLEILINYLLKQNNYQAKQPICEIKFNSNLYLSPLFIQFFNINKFITINKLISLYEILEEKLWETIADRYINKCFHCTGSVEKLKVIINKFIKNENSRELKNDMLISLLIKFICRYLPYAGKNIENKDLFKTIVEKNSTLPTNIKNELLELTKEWGIEVKNAIDLTKRIVSMVQSENNKVTTKLNESIISEVDQNLNEDNYENNDEEEDNSEERDF